MEIIEKELIGAPMNAYKLLGTPLIREVDMEGRIAMSISERLQISEDLWNYLYPLNAFWEVTVYKLRRFMDEEKEDR